MKRTIPPLLTAAALAAGCGTVSTSASSGGGEDAVTVESCGRDVTVDGVPERVVSMHPSLTELLVQLGVGDRVVAQAQDALGEPSPELAAEVDAITSISADVPPTREDLLAQSPDFVISGTEYEFSAEQGFAGYEDLEKAGAPAYVATAGCIDRRSEGAVADTFTDLENLGRIFGVEDRASELVTQAEQDLAEIEEIIGDDDPVRAVQVYVEGGKLYAIGGAVEIDVLRLGGGENLFAGDSRFDDFFAAEVNPEVVVDLQPDAFVFAVNDAAHEEQTRAYLEQTLADTPAVRNGLLVAVDNTYVQPGTLSAITGARIVAEALHG
ncbi:ABC transporter substrate-binding protein [Aeromicrobium alkaliterrae]|uniref:ABC transporter substrate-binding protein n=1 Tax=Aeromicrobium alkaliterrae TaxID=302168 RepID=A0ABP4W3N5_9ACTN